MKKRRLKITTKLMLLDNLLYLFFGAIVYPLIPYLLNYPSNSIDNQFQSVVVGMQYTDQFVLIFILGLLLNWITLYFFFRKLNNWQQYTKTKTKENVQHILKIRDLCANGIYRLIPTQLAINAIVLIVVFTAASTEIVLTLKLTGIICIWTTVADLLLYVFSGKLFDTILKETYSFVQKEEDTIIRTNIGRKMNIQFVSCLLVILFVMTLFGYSRILYERGEFLKEKELNELNTLITKDLPTIEKEIKSKNSKSYFILNDKGYEAIPGYKMSKFAREYILHNPDGNRVYYQYGSSIEGVFKKVIYQDKTFYIGKMYDVMPGVYTLAFIAFDICLLTLYVVVISCFTRRLKYQLDVISESLKEIGDSQHEVGTQLPITSNDEFSDIIRSYNVVQANTEEYIKELKEKQEIIVKQGQLVSIGELAGGVAHDINTPISAIKTGIIMLNSMTNERTPEEQELLQRMDNCATKIINIVNSMRNQIRNLGGDTHVKFKISDVINDIKIITYHEVAKNRSEVEMEIIDDVSIMGDPTKLGQVLTNLVVNAAQAYDAKGGKIKIMVRKSKHNALIDVIDFAKGIDPTIAPFVFKNILTTKGTSGTGLGLYLTYSVIKGEFNGEITFDTKEGEGTTFHIAIPLA